MFSGNICIFVAKPCECASQARSSQPFGLDSSSDAHFTDGGSTKEQEFFSEQLGEKFGYFLLYRKHGMKEGTNYQESTNTQIRYVDADGYAGSYNTHGSYHLITPLSPTLIPLPSILMAAPFIES